MQDSNIMYQYMHKIIERDYNDDLDEDLKAELEATIGKTCWNMRQSPISVNDTLHLVLNIYKKIGKHTPGILEYFKIILSRDAVILRLRCLLTSGYLECIDSLDNEPAELIDFESLIEAVLEDPSDLLDNVDSSIIHQKQVCKVNNVLTHPRVLAKVTREQEQSYGKFTKKYV